MPSTNSQKTPVSTNGIVLLLVAYVAAAYIFFPDELPALYQRLLGAGCVVLAMIAFLVATRETESTDEMMTRLRRGQHEDYGKQLLAARAKQSTVNIPILGAVSKRLLQGICVFAVVTVWWFTPFSPVTVKGVEVADISRVLGDEINAAVLIMPDGKMAVVQPPLVPPHAREHALLIEENADLPARARKATAEGRFSDARKLLKEVEESRAARPLEITVSKAQNEMFAFDYTAAAELYAKAVELSPEDHWLLCQQAMASVHQGNFGKAAAAVQKAEDICRKKSEEKTPALATVLHVKSLVLLGKGNYKEAVKLSADVMNIRGNLLDPFDPLMAASANNRAALGLLVARFDGVKALFGGAEDIWRKSLGKNNPLVATALLNTAMLHVAVGQIAEAKQFSDRAAAIHRDSLPEQHPIRMMGMASKIAVLVVAGELEPARELADKLTPLLEEVIPSWSPMKPTVITPLAALSAAESRYGKARLYYLAARENIKNIHGDAHPYKAVVLEELAKLDVVRGLFDQAEATCRKAVKISQKALGEEHPQTASHLNALGELEIKRGRSHKAFGYVKQALELRRKSLGKEHPDVARSLGNLASLKNSPRTIGDGVKNYRQAIEMAETFLGKQHAEVARLARGLALLQAKQSEVDSAEKQFNRAIAIEEKVLPPFHPDLAGTLEDYAALLEAADPPQTEKAGQLIERARSISIAHTEKNREE